MWEENLGTQAGVRLIWGTLNTGFTVFNKNTTNANTKIKKCIIFGSIVPLVGCHHLWHLTRMLQWETNSVFQHAAPKTKQKLLSIHPVRSGTYTCTVWNGHLVSSALQCM